MSDDSKEIPFPYVFAEYYMDKSGVYRDASDNEEIPPGNGYLLTKDQALEFLRLKEEVETLRLQLAACGVAALCNTKESCDQQRIEKTNPYYSASYQDVCNMVDREMRLRQQVEIARNGLKKVMKADDYGSCSSAYSEAYDCLEEMEKVK